MDLRPPQEPPAHYVFVLTRSADTASTRYLLRRAAALSRQGYPTTLFLADHLLEPLPDLDAGATEARIQVRRLVWDPAPVGPQRPDAPLASSEAELVALMLQPGVQTIWC